jgi:hypothetical protein
MNAWIEKRADETEKAIGLDYVSGHICGIWCHVMRIGNAQSVQFSVAAHCFEANEILNAKDIDDAAQRAFSRVLDTMELYIRDNR